MSNQTDSINQFRGPRSGALVLFAHPEGDEGYSRVILGATSTRGGVCIAIRGVFLEGRDVSETNVLAWDHKRPGETFLGAVDVVGEDANPTLRGDEPGVAEAIKQAAQTPVAAPQVAEQPVERPQWFYTLSALSSEHADLAWKWADKQEILPSNRGYRGTKEEDFIISFAWSRLEMEDSDRGVVEDFWARVCRCIDGEPGITLPSIPQAARDWVGGDK